MQFVMKKTRRELNKCEENMQLLIRKRPGGHSRMIFFYPVGRESFYNLRVRVAIHMLNKFSVTSRWLTALVMRRDGGGNGASIKLCP